MNARFIFLTGLTASAVHWTVLGTARREIALSVAKDKPKPSRRYR
jgi:hypothetical protein